MVKLFSPFNCSFTLISCFRTITPLVTTIKPSNKNTIKRSYSTKTTTAPTTPSKPHTHYFAKSPRLLKHRSTQAFVSTRTTFNPTTTTSTVPQPQHPHHHRIVIVGGGASGLELATRLGNDLGKHQKADVLLISRELTHLWKPHLHMYASGTLNSSEDELNYFNHAAKNHYGFHLGTLTNIHPKEKRITLAPTMDSLHSGEVIAPERYVEYDTLVLAIGSQGNDFNTPGAIENSLFLDSRSQADHFQKEFINCYLKAQGRHIAKYHGDFVQGTVNPDHNFDLNIAIIGAGMFFTSI